jgi:hypothetical protein
MATPAYIFDGCGQSNMEGDNGYSPFTGEGAAISTARIFHKRPFSTTGITGPTGAFETLDYSARNNYHWLADNYDHAGPELALALQFAANKPLDTLYINKVAYGGTGIDPATSLPYWAPGGILRERELYEYLPEALEYLCAQGFEPQVMSMRNQWESDASNAGIAGRFAANTISYLNEKREALGINIIPTILVDASTGGNYSQLATIKAQMQVIRDSVPGVDLLDVESLAHQASDLPHFVTYSYRVMGQYAADRLAGGFSARYTALTPMRIAPMNRLIWMDASSLGSSPVASVSDRFTQFNMAQSSGSLRPTWSATGLNGRAAILFDATTHKQHLTINAAMTADRWNGNAHNLYVLVDGKLTDASTPNVFVHFKDGTVADEIILAIRDNAGTPEIGWYTDSNGWVTTECTSDIQTALEASSGCVLQWVLGAQTNGTGKLYLNGKEILSGAYTPRRLGNASTISNGVTGLTGALADVAIYRCDPTLTFVTKGMLARSRANRYAARNY